MKSIVIYPDNPKQFSVIQAFLEEMKIRFKSQEDIIISEEIKQSVLEGIKDADEGRLISSEEVRKKQQLYVRNRMDRKSRTFISGNFRVLDQS